jgi:hypothetical protein
MFVIGYGLAVIAPRRVADLTELTIWDRESD